MNNDVDDDSPRKTASHEMTPGEHPWSKVVNTLSHGLLVAFSDGALVAANLAAATELEARELLWVDDGRLSTRDPRQTRALRAALRDAGGGRGSLVTVGVPDMRVLSLAVTPLGFYGYCDPMYVGVVMSRMSMCDPIMLCFFARTRGLTYAEEQVLGMLAKGHAAQDVAKDLAVAVSTVRSHIKSICAKTGSSGVRSLMRQLAVLPPLRTTQLSNASLGELACAAE